MKLVDSLGGIQEESGLGPREVGMELCRLLILRFVFSSVFFLSQEIPQKYPPSVSFPECPAFVFSNSVSQLQFFLFLTSFFVEGYWGFIMCCCCLPPQAYSNRLKYGLVEAVYEWARGMPFKDVMKLTTLQVGGGCSSIIWFSKGWWWWRWFQVLSSFMSYSVFCWLNVHFFFWSAKKACWFWSCVIMRSFSQCRKEM
mgnify:CR=1 FL=1